MDDRQAHGYVLTLHLEADQITSDIADRVAHELAHLSAVRGPVLAGNVHIHCTVSAVDEADAVRYAAQRTVSALLSAGIDAPRVLAVDASPFDSVTV